MTFCAPFALLSCATCCLLMKSCMDTHLCTSFAHAPNSSIKFLPSLTAKIPYPLHCAMCTWREHHCGCLFRRSPSPTRPSRLMLCESRKHPVKNHPAAPFRPFDGVRCHHESPQNQRLPMQLGGIDPQMCPIVSDPHQAVRLEYPISKYPRQLEVCVAVI